MYKCCALALLVIPAAANVLYFVKHEEDVSPAHPASTDGVMCPDGRSECAIGQTCCQLISGAYGCCPYPKAVCCKDHLHCCPERARCDLRRKKCLRREEQLPLAVPLPARLVAEANTDHLKEEILLLRDEERKLQQEENKLIQNKILLTKEKIKLTKELIHLAQIENQSTENSVELTHKLAENGNVTRQKNIVCPDGQSECPEGSTCCKLASGQYGCCPVPKAVCCSDHTHCCPSGTTCDTSQGKCNRGEVSTPWVKKQPALPRMNANSVVCPGGQSQCPDGSTCCKLATGQYGCCPLIKAVCCSDHTHCCPSGTTCDVSKGRCQRGYSPIRWHEMPLSRPVSKPAETDIKCPDGQSECPDGNTCCKLASGQYGCCPLPKAVCCSDHIHCCPTGTTCDVKEGKCTRGHSSVPWVTKLPARAAVEPIQKNIECPDGQSQCPDTSTCCKLASGQYGCCPFPKAQCCSDHRHCCPQGSSCDVSKGSCVKGELNVPWAKKEPATPK